MNYDRVYQMPEQNPQGGTLKVAKRDRPALRMVIVFALALLAALIAVRLLYFRPSHSTIDFSLSVDQIRKAEMLQPKKIEIPPDLYPLIADSLNGSRIDRNPAKWVYLGEMKVEMKHSTNYQVQIFYVREKDGAFAIGDWPTNIQYYRGGKSDAVRQLMIKSGALSEGDL